MNHCAPNGLDEGKLLSVKNLETGEWEQFEIRFMSDLVRPGERPYLTRTDSRVEEYNERVARLGWHVLYSDYIIHVRKLLQSSDESGPGNAVWDSLDLLLEAIDGGEYRIG